MTVIFPFYAGDADMLQRLLRWIGLLGGCKSHQAVLCADAGVPYQVATDLREIASNFFAKVTIIATPQPVIGWPQGANALFRCSATHCNEAHTGPWLFCETDCVPLCVSWLDLLEKRYQETGKPILGAVIPCKDPAMPAQHVSGCAIYPENFIHQAVPVLDANPVAAFDISLAGLAVPMAANDRMFQCFWGEKGNPPTFVHNRTRPGEFTIGQIKPEAVLFHRNKDGTLIDLLKQKFFPQSPSPANQEFIVTLPFNNKDAVLQIECVKWMREMGQEKRYDCLLSTDHSTIGPFVGQLQDVARMVFKRVDTLVYPTPPRQTWPQAPNWAFQHTAMHMYRVVKRPWLWKEADMIPLKFNWIECLQAEYIACRKPFMGSVVVGMHHANGTAIYPYNTPEICKRGMKCVDEAFDTAQAWEMMPHTHDASNLLQHAWGMVDGRLDPKVGDPIVFRSVEDVKAWINPEAVTFHRTKTISLIQQLRKMRA